MLFQAFTGEKANPEGVTTQPGANSECMANTQAFRRLSLRISFRADTALANVEALGSVENSGTQTSQPPNMWT